MIGLFPQLWGSCITFRCWLNGKMAVIFGIIVLTIIACLNMPKSVKADSGEVKVNAA